MHVLANAHDLIRFVDDSQLRIKGLSTSVYVDPHKVGERARLCVYVCVCVVPPLCVSDFFPSPPAPSSPFLLHTLFLPSTLRHAPMQESVVQWDEALTNIRAVLEAWLDVQGMWCHLAPLFGPNGLSGQLLLEVRVQGQGVGVRQRGSTSPYPSLLFQSKPLKSH
jgi:hypothetical protein